MSFHFFALVCLAVIACGPAEKPQVSTETQAVGSASPCELVPVDDEGTLPSCAAGSPSAEGPGKPFDDTGSNTPLPLSAADQAATAAANALSAARNPSPQQRVNRGFGVGGQP